MSHHALWIFLVVAFAGCSDDKQGYAPSESSVSYFEIEGFYVFPLKELSIGLSTEEVGQKLGEPTESFESGFKKPQRVDISSIPSFDQQWAYQENMGTNWIFFRDGKLIAAFREESDF